MIRLLRSVSFFLTCFLTFSSYADTQLLLWPEDALSTLSVYADYRDNSSATSFNDDALFELTANKANDSNTLLPHSVDHNRVIAHQTNQECCRSYAFLGIPISRAWWVSIQHDGKTDYLCDRNDAIGQEPKLYVQVVKSGSSTRLTFQTGHYCEENNRIASSTYVPSNWKSVSVDIH